MKWVDYREKLGIGFSDIQKVNMLSAMLKNYIENVIKENYDENSHLNYCQMVGEDYHDYMRPYQYLSSSLDRCNSIEELVAKYIALYNVYPASYIGYSYNAVSKGQVLQCLKESLGRLNIKYEIFEDEDGIFIFPSGAKELDDALVSEPLDWLNDYPNTRKIYTIALQQYSNGQYIRDVADNFRKAFEEFLKEFFNNDNDLNKNKKEVEAYLKEQNAAPQLITMLVSLISHYYLLNNEVAKHNDKMHARYLEFLMYQTGVFIRMLIVVKKDSEMMEARSPNFKERIIKRG